MSTPHLLTRAARFSLLAEQVSCFDWLWRLEIKFWQMSAAPAAETTAHLPVLAAAVNKTYLTAVLWELARHPLPDVLPPEVVPWHARLVEAWEVLRASGDSLMQNAAQRALVGLDGCGMPDGMQRPSRLPEWLEEARQIAGATGWFPLETLGALAAWRPAPGIVTNPETLRDWVAFWQELGRFRCRIRKGMAAMALLNLPEADLRVASLRLISPERLLRDMARALPATAERTALSKTHDHPPLLGWQPEGATALPAAGVAEVARSWLNITRHRHEYCRRKAWEQLTHWDRAGSLTACGIDLLPHLVPVVKNGKDGASLYAVSHWMPTAQRLTRAGTGSDSALLRELEAGWRRHRQDEDWWKRQYGWLGSIRLHQAGLASELPQAFLKAYLPAVAQECHPDVLFVLAQWVPGSKAPLDVFQKWQRGWQHRLEDTRAYVREVAAFALAHQALEAGTGDAFRRLALEVWRTGTKAAAVAHRLGNIASRFYEVRAELAAGRVPHFEDELPTPAQIHYPRLALRPGHIAGREWKMENEKLKMENSEGVLKPGPCLAPDGPSR